MWDVVCGMWGWNSEQRRSQFVAPFQHREHRLVLTYIIRTPLEVPHNQTNK